MRTIITLLAGATLAGSMWITSGIGVLVGKSDNRPGGEVGWYFACTYFAPHRSFEVNFTDAARASPGVTSMWEKRVDCPLLIHQSRATIGWRR